jgi:hypothetical protein
MHGDSTQRGRFWILPQPTLGKYRKGPEGPEVPEAPEVPEEWNIPLKIPPDFIEITGTCVDTLLGLCYNAEIEHIF